MQTSIFLARLLGPLLVLAAVALLTNPRMFRTVTQDVIGSVTSLFMLGSIEVVAGLAIVLTHNVWVADWRLLITLIGWLLLIRGAARILLTERFARFAGKAVSGGRLFQVAGVVLAVFGLVFCYFGYRA